MGVGRESQLASFDRYLRFQLAAEGVEVLSQGEHRAMVEAARARDISRAVDILRQHMATAAGILARFFNERR